MSYPPYGAPGGYPPQATGQPGYPVIMIYYYYNAMIYSIVCDDCHISCLWICYQRV